MEMRSSFHRTTLATLVAASVLTLPAVAAAEGSYADAIPNGGGCDTCHTASMPDVNDFGADMGTGTPDWSALWNLDSDGDGQTNGEELGDPCGDWTVGATPARETDISNPGDANDTSADPNTPACTTGSGGGSTGGGGESSASGGSGTTGTGGDGTVGMAGDGAGGESTSGGDDGDDGGCSCTAAGGTSGTLAGWSGLAALLALCWVRRRR